MSSIKDVARVAGVSVMTASRVINMRGSVSPKTRARVTQAIKELDYRPNLTARSLRARRSQLIGLLIPDIENPIFASLAKHIEEEAQRFGYSVMLGNTWEDASREARHLEIMMGRQMDGIVIAPVSTENDALIRQCLTPVVVLDRSLNHNAPPPAITVDNHEVGRLAARHLVELGHRHFACLSGPLHIDIFTERLKGFREELHRGGCRIEAVLNADKLDKVGYGVEYGNELLKVCDKRPLAVFCANDLTALGTMHAAHRLGLSVPQDIALVGVDDIPAAGLAVPSLTTIRQPIPEIAAAGVKLLVDMLNDKEYKPENVTLKPSLVVRESTTRVVGNIRKGNA